MTQIMKFFLIFSLVISGGELLYIFQLGIDEFATSIFKYLVLELIYYFIAFFIANYIRTFLFYVVGKIHNLKSSILLFYPFFIFGGKLKFSFSLIKLATFTNTYDISNVGIKEIVLFRDKGRKSEKEVNYCLTFISIAFLCAGVIFKVSLLYFIFVVFVLMFVIEKTFQEMNLFSTNKDLPFFSLLFSEEVKEEILYLHLHYFIKDIEGFLNTPQNFNYIHSIMFAYYNQARDKMNDLYLLDKEIYDLLKYQNEQLSISCRTVIFEYLDNRICLNNMTNDNKNMMLDMLDLFIDIDWGMRLPKLCLTRYLILKEKIENQEKGLQLRKCFYVYIKK